MIKWVLFWNQGPIRIVQGRIQTLNSNLYNFRRAGKGLKIFHQMLNNINILFNH